MADTADLIRRARELASMWETFGKLGPNAQTPTVLRGLADELERLRNENVRLKGSTFYECPDCGATCMGDD